MRNWANKTTMAILWSVLLLQGCVIAVNTDEERWSDWRKEQNRNEARIRGLEMGVGLAAVEEELGNPDFVDTFMRDGVNYRVLYYRTRKVHGDGRTTRDETTPVVFADGKLVGWGESAVARAAP